MRIGVDLGGTEIKFGLFRLEKKLEIKVRNKLEKKLEKNDKY